MKRSWTFTVEGQPVPKGRPRTVTREGKSPSGTVLDRDKLIACIRQDRGLGCLLERVGAGGAEGLKIVERFVTAHLFDGDPIAMLREVTEETLNQAPTNGQTRLDIWRERMNE